MQHTESNDISRRLFAVAAISVGAGLIGRRQLFAKDEGIVPTMVNAAAKAKISIQPIGRNISVLEGSGGNIAVFNGTGRQASGRCRLCSLRPAITNALASINADPIKHLINTHWHTDHTDGNAWLHSAGAAFTAPKTLGNTFRSRPTSSVTS
jgi:glyoxylase-like metal-dependent hydrolase (beta-lactamase superfamily II)